MAFDPAPPLSGHVVFLNGTPSSGKSTLAAALRELLSPPYIYLSLDDFRRGYLSRYWQSDDGTLFRHVMHGYLLSLRAMASIGHRIIAEAVVTTERLDMYLTLFADIPVLFVGVRCPLGEAQRREAARTDRRRGSVDLAVPDFDSVHAHGAYDLEVDTSILSPAEAAQEVAEGIANWPATTAFELLRSRRGRVEPFGEGRQGQDRPN